MTETVKILFVVIATYLSFSANIKSRVLDKTKEEDAAAQVFLKIITSLAIYIILIINWNK